MRYLIAIWLMLLTVLSLGPQRMKYRILRTQGQMHNPGHFILFMITAMLMCWQAGSVSSRILRGLGAVLVGVTQEWLEAVIYHNPYEWRDLKVDSLGIAAGFIFVSLLQRTSVPASEA